MLFREVSAQWCREAYVWGDRVFCLEEDAIKPYRKLYMYHVLRSCSTVIKAVGCTVTSGTALHP